ncbi:MAG: type II toxin-antitoxin system VapC family toxin [Rhodocyclaceae bacterium]|nr:type II toxin-antitoxin system VapC family toxin [Rhodocyclaceae bacterium]
MLVDSNVLIDVFGDDPVWLDWSVTQLRNYSKIHRLFINPVIYAEVSVAFSSIEHLEQELDALQIKVVEVPRPALFLAAKAHGEYRRRGGTRTGVLPDFFIGAQALVMRMPMLTRDARRYETYFSGLQIVAPRPN